MTAVGCQSISIWANASEGAWCIVTSEGALITQLQALVHIFAHLMSPGRVSVITRALETAVDITASAIAADILHGQALVVVYTSSSSFIQYISGRALTSK